MMIETDLSGKQKAISRLILTILGALVLVLVDIPQLTLLLGVILTIVWMNLTFVYAFLSTLERDFVFLIRYLTFSSSILYSKYKGWSVARVFQEYVKKNPKKTCYAMDDRALTFQQVEEYTNKLGAYFKSKGLKHGDSVALFMETRIEYTCCWLALSKIGVITALINSNQRRETLLHSVRVAQAKAVIVGTELNYAWEEAPHDEHTKSLPVFQFSDEEQRCVEQFELMKGAIDLNKELINQKAEDLSADIGRCDISTKLLYIYTSGTTGLPKAAIITNLRFLFLASATYYVFCLKPNDVVYDPLPLYHSAGTIVGAGQALLFGCTVVVRKKFSASNFWKDCIKHKCTCAQYIGEMCRYLLSTPPKPEDTQHKVRLMYGNGLRPQIWSQFVARFNIANIGEIYGSTEGSSGLANATGRVGAIGFVPIWGRPLFPCQIVKCDEDTGEPLRNSNGFCERVNTGVPGLLVCEVDSTRAETSFDGYADKEATRKKLIRDVFKKNDVYFNSGDMLVMDIWGYYYFKDRTGDTFRWRGENVSTLEVEATITNVIGLRDCCVYGVDIPHIEGKAGMAAIVDAERSLDFQQLSVGIRGSLPPYARPLFVRIMNEIPRTGTYKFKKRELVQESFDINRIKDPIYYLNKDGIYRPLTKAQYEDLLNGAAGL